MTLNKFSTFSTSPKPPSLHWAVVLALTIVTFGLFGFIWLFVQARFARQIDPANKSVLQALCALMLFAFSFLMSFITALTVMRGGQATDLGSVMSMVRFFEIVMVISAYTQIRKALMQHYGIKLNAILTVVLNVYYIQYHLTRIAKAQSLPVTVAAANA